MGEKRRSKGRLFNAEVLAQKLNFDPLEILTRIAINDWKGLGYDSSCFHIEKPDGSTRQIEMISLEMRMQAAKEIAKYLYAAKQAIALSTPDGAIKVLIEDYTTKK